MMAEVGRGDGGCQTISRGSLLTLGCKCRSFPRLQFCQIQCQAVECSANVANKRGTTRPPVGPNAGTNEG